MEKMSHADRAEKLFLSGYNCAQAVLCAFEDVTGMDSETAARAASSFGAGMGMLREVCGTVSGALLALGLACGYSDPADREGKKEQYRLVQEFAARFREQNGSIICRELLQGAGVVPGKEPGERTKQYYAKRPCSELARESAAILDEILEQIRAEGKMKEGSV